MSFIPSLLGLLLACLHPLTLAAAQVAGENVDLASFRATLGQMVAADTSNPPGNEQRIVAIVARRLNDAGIPYQIIDFATGRQNIVARLKGNGSEKPLLLLAHIDVVPTTDQKWETDPHKMTEKDGYLAGRGVGDDLGMAAMELEELLRLKRTGAPLRRDVILALTGDEETGGLGIRTVLERRPDLIDASIALNEGAGPILDGNGKVKFVGMQTAEKAYLDLTLTTKGATGHSSVPLADNSIYRLARALDRLSRLEMPAHLLPVTRGYFARRASLEPAKLAAAMKALSQAKGALPQWAVRELDKEPVLGANLRTTCVATMLGGGTKVNALPAQATANVNCRILPDESIAQVQTRLAAAIADPKVIITPILDAGVPGASPVDGEVPKTIQKVAAEMWPGAPVIPTMSRGATDSRYLRPKGIASYGINPIALMEADAHRAHGIDERIPIASIQPGIEFLHRLVVELAGATRKTASR